MVVNICGIPHKVIYDDVINESAYQDAVESFVKIIESCIP